jgi:altronate hydrolase
VIGILSKDVKAGEWIHSQNLGTSLASREGGYVYTPGGIINAKPSDKTWKGFLRSNGEAGTRNDLFLVPTVGCVNGPLAEIKKAFLAKHPEMEGRVKVLSHPYGCSQLGDDLKNTAAILAGLCHNPNAGGVLLMGLGCENNRFENFLPILGKMDENRFISFNGQDVDDDVEYGVDALEKLYKTVKEDKRVTLPLSKLRLGLKCGGSDGLSGLTANPLVGLVSDTVGASGGQIALTEVPEMFGAEQALMNRAKDEKVYKDVVALIENFKAYYARNGQPCYENPSPGNKDGGITTLEEKSNGCVLKGGHLPVTEVLQIGERIKTNELSLVNGPGNDLVASTNLAAAGCSIIIFTTGRGTPFGAAVPTIKVATNHELAKKKANWIDYDAGRVLDYGFEKTHEELLDKLLAIASGEESAKSEQYEEGLIAIFKGGVTL